MITANPASCNTTEIAASFCAHCLASAKASGAAVPAVDLIATASDLLFELQAAEKIILAMLNNLSIEQKQAVAVALQPYGLFDDGLTRHDARLSAILRAMAGMSTLRPAMTVKSISK
jgi:hypothetical protein